MSMLQSQLKPAKDSPYNNKEGVNLQKVAGLDCSQLRYELCCTPVPSATSYLKQESYALKTFSMGELKLAVRNRYCQCVWDMEEMFEHLQDNLFVDNETGRTCYYCIGCLTKYYHNKRLIQQLYLDSQLTMYVGQAKRYHAKTQSKIPFKDGRITISEKGVVTYFYRIKTQTGFVHEQILLKDGRQRQQDQLIQYNHGDCFSGVDNFTTFAKTYCGEISERVSKLAQWLLVGGVITPDVKGLLYEEISSNVAEVVLQNSKLVNLRPISKQFTFAFSTPCHMSDHCPDMLFLVLFYPVLRLWRKVLVTDQNGKQLPPIDSGVYIRDPNTNCIYVVGGCRIRYEPAPEGNTSRIIYTRSFKYSRACYRLDLSKFDEQKGSGKNILKKISQKGKVVEAEVPVIPTLYSSNLTAEALRPFPQDLSLAAGLFYNNCLFVFGGSFSKDNFNETVLKCAYRMNLAGNKQWEKLPDMPRTRHNHAVFARDGKIYILGGTETSGFQVRTSRFVDIYDPAKNSYEAVEMKDNEYLNTLPTEVFGERCMVCKMNADEYLLVNGTPSTSFVFNARTRSFTVGGSQVKLPVMAKGWKSTDYTLPGPKLQQIFDTQPPQHNGFFYYIHNSLVEEQLRIIYGTRNKWYTSREISPTPETQ